MAFNEKDYQKISTDRTFIIDCYTEMLSRINEKELVDLINNTEEGKKFEENIKACEKMNHFQNQLNSRIVKSI